MGVCMLVVSVLGLSIPRLGSEEFGANMLFFSVFFGRSEWVQAIKAPIVSRRRAVEREITSWHCGMRTGLNH